MLELRRSSLVLVAVLAGAAACGSSNRETSDGTLDGGPGSGPGADGGPTGDGSPGGDAADAAPPPVCDPDDFGAKRDGKTKDTAALQAAIDACAGKGGTVHLHDGTYLSGMLRLKSDLVLHIDASAQILGTQDDADYPRQEPPIDNTQLINCRKALLYAEGVTNLRLEGAGTINGNGNAPQWIGPKTVHPEATRPMAFFAVKSKNVSIKDVTISHAAMWGLVNMEVDGLTIDHVSIDTLYQGNRDGIDVVDCHHVLIKDSTIHSEDDSICIKTGSRYGVEDVQVKNCRVSSLIANALKFGTASYGSFKNVTFDGITVESADKAAMAVESVDGADISNINFKNIAFKDVGSPIFIILGDRGETPVSDKHKIGTIDGVHFENVSGDTMRYNWSSPISGFTKDGTTYRLKNLTFTNVKIMNKGGMGSVPADPPEYVGQYPDPNLWGNMPAFGLFVRHADNVTLTNSTPLVVGTDARQGIVQRDVTGLVTN
ncbi:MAG TPA: glycosyl hydrolase family 28 protein [Labilithrix sp.]|nr:glycosyl hydrolase family 28 protein [Labilithrix sp.]